MQNDDFDLFTVVNPHDMPAHFLPHLKPKIRARYYRSYSALRFVGEHLRSRMDPDGETPEVMHFFFLVEFLTPMLNLSPATVSRHLAVLEKANLILRNRSYGRADIAQGDGTRQSMDVTTGTILAVRMDPYGEEPLFVPYLMKTRSWRNLNQDIFDRQTAYHLKMRASDQNSSKEEILGDILTFTLKRNHTQNNTLMLMPSLQENLKPEEKISIAISMAVAAPASQRTQVIQQSARELCFTMDDLGVVSYRYYLWLLWRLCQMPQLVQHVVLTLQKVQIEARERLSLKLKPTRSLGAVARKILNHDGTRNQLMLKKTILL
ncbi:ArsR family transcriptional regulator [Deinococcus roseus]|uniref:HTH arsR-type domain-containing protein n=1 Tax=Deinococcus roseus TaxID=392414 RepID=A0ABQ2D7G3_9DEIO|nr:ArsR family transcriptional regulator [Deinococcus roseus]GGJ48088.1 hypothetical protein GCM10008938_37620 [Deinococcus roseus]